MHLTHCTAPRLASISNSEEYEVCLNRCMPRDPSAVSRQTTPVDKKMKFTNLNIKFVHVDAGNKSLALNRYMCFDNCTRD